MRLVYHRTQSTQYYQIFQDFSLFILIFSICQGGERLWCLGLKLSPISLNLSFEISLVENPHVFYMQGQVEALLEHFWTCLLVTLYPRNKGLIVAQVLS